MKMNRETKQILFQNQFSAEVALSNILLAKVINEST